MVMEAMVSAVVSFFCGVFYDDFDMFWVRILIKNVRKMGKLKKVCIFANRITKN
jgi:hypothetical protein